MSIREAYRQAEQSYREQCEKYAMKQNKILEAALEEQEEVEQQIEFLRRLYGVVRSEMEKAPGGNNSIARGVALIAGSLILEAAEQFEGGQIAVRKR